METTNKFKESRMNIEKQISRDNDIFDIKIQRLMFSTVQIKYLQLAFKKIQDNLFFKELCEKLRLTQFCQITLLNGGTRDSITTKSVMKIGLKETYKEHINIELCFAGITEFKTFTRFSKRFEECQSIITRDLGERFSPMFLHDDPETFTISMNICLTNEFLVQLYKNIEKSNFLEI